jgi:hypothetical protein
MSRRSQLVRKLEERTSPPEGLRTVVIRYDPEDPTRGGPVPPAEDPADDRPVQVFRFPTRYETPELWAAWQQRREGTSC